jgi:hypothetical protein
LTTADLLLQQKAGAQRGGNPKTFPFTCPAFRTDTWLNDNQLQLPLHSSIIGIEPYDAVHDSNRKSPRYVSDAKASNSTPETA